VKQLELPVLDPRAELAPVVPLDQSVREELLAFMITAIVSAYIRSSEQERDE